MRYGVAARVSFTVTAIIVVEAVVCGLSAAPVVAVWWWWQPASLTIGRAVQLALVSLAIVPSYVLFALGLIVWSPLATKLTGARTPAGVEMRIRDFDWRLMQWARYVAAIHVVRLFAGTLLRGSPVWTMYLRLNGARIGHRAYINSTQISDHNLLVIGDDAVIGADVHLSGHTVEGGIVKTAPVRVGRRVTIGIGSIVSIDVELADGCEIGALSLVTKHSRLQGDAVYAGIPVRRVA